MNEESQESTIVHGRTFEIAVLGRTLEHLGVQMYKRRDAAIAELVANCWDAGAKNVWITVPAPETYSPSTDEIVIVDDGEGMNDDQVQDKYLIIGRNRRREDGEQVNNRLVMGRKGIGKLAGFGIASEMVICTWRDEISTELALNIDTLTLHETDAKKIAIPGTVSPVLPELARSSGTRITLHGLKHKTPIDTEELLESLGRRFSRVVRGQMEILVNGTAVQEPNIELDYRFPEAKDYQEETLSDGSVIRYYYGFAVKPIRRAEMRGFTVYVRGKTAQAPPFFFNVEGTASGQHGTRYVTGAIEADFLDAGTSDSDLISTDRQEIDWESDQLAVLYAWGQQVSRHVLRQQAQIKGEALEHSVLADPGLRYRIDRLESTSRAQISKFLQILGKSDPDPERTLDLASTMVRAFEYRQFHDLIEQIEDASQDPVELERLLANLHEWKVLESRAILEIVKGRIDILEKFHTMIVNNLPETASRIGGDNMHDLIASYPWLLNPDWQVLAEEKTISKQLAEWNSDDIRDEDSRLRYDFIALSDERRLIVVDIKRSGHAVELDELQRLEKYKERLGTASDKLMYMVMVCSGVENVTEDYRRLWQSRSDGEIQTWSDLYSRTQRHYAHYKAVLEGDVQHRDFAIKAREVAQTRSVVHSGSVYRGPAARKGGLGPQDIQLSLLNE